MLDFAPRQRAAPAPKPKPGRLFLDSRPWSEVYLGKHKLGLTPLLGHRLPPGTHTLMLINPSRGLQKTVKVTIQAGRKTKLRVELEK